MGRNQHGSSSACWYNATNLLGRNTPVVYGSPYTATAYLVYVEHQLVSKAGGSSTGLGNSSQFFEAGGKAEPPEPISLDNHGLQVEVESAHSFSNNPGILQRHRM